MYSFDATQEAAYASYDTVLAAYRRLFTALRLPYVVAEADAGSIGGSRTHEFHALTPVGEDLLLSCPACAYTANVEKARGRLPPAPPVPVSGCAPRRRRRMQLTSLAAARRRRGRH